MNIGSLEIELIANIARLTRDMDDAKSVVGKTAKQIQSHVDSIKGVFSSLAGILAANYFVKLIDGAIDAQDSLGKLAKSTGNSVAMLAQLRSIGALSETSIDAIAAASVKLSKNFATADGTGKGAALAIKALGINFDEFKRMDADQRILVVAQAMSRFKDGSDKTAAAVALFGKSGAEILPFLADLGERSDDITKKLTAQEKATQELRAQQADTFGDNLTIIRKNQAAWQKELSMALLPALADVTQAMVNMDKTGGGLRAQIKAMSDDGSLADYLRSAATIGSYVIDVLQLVWRGVESLGKIIGTWMAEVVTGVQDLASAVTKAVNGDIAGALQVFKQSAVSEAEAVSAAGQDIANIWGAKTLGASFRESLDSVSQLGEGSKKAQKDLDLAGVLAANEAAEKAAADAAKKHADQIAAATKAGTDFIAGLQITNAELQKELANGEALSPTQKELIKLDKDLASGKMSLSAAQITSAKNAIAANAELQNQIEIEKDARKVYQDNIDSINKKAGAIEDEAKKLQESNATALLTKEQLQKLEIARLNDQIRIEAQIVSTNDLNGVCTEETEAHRNTLKALQDLAAAKEQGIAVQAAKDANEEWNKTVASIKDGLTDALMRAFENGKGFADAFKDTLKNAFKTMILEPQVKAIVSSGADVLGGLFGASGSASGSGGLGSIFSSLGSLFGIGGSGATPGITGAASGAPAASSGAGLAGMASLFSAAGPMLAAVAIGKTLYDKISGDYKIDGGLGKILGVTTGSVLGIGVGGVIGGLANRAFGMGKKNTTAQGIDATISGGDFEGMAYNEWKQKGGWFRKNKKGTDYSDLDAETSQALDTSAASVFASITNYAEVLGLPAESLKKVTYKLRVQLSDDDEANQKAINDEFQKYGDTLAAQYTSLLKPFVKAGEQLSDTLGRLASLKVFSETINQFGGIFSRIASLGIDAKEQLIGFAGGMEALINKTKTFVDQYYSEGERFGMQSKQIQEALSAIGINSSQLQTRDQFRSLVESQNLNDENGRKVTAALLDIAPMFAGISDYLVGQNITLGQSAAQSPQTALLESIFGQNKTAVSSAAQMVDRQDLTNNYLQNIDYSLNSYNQSLMAALGNLPASLAEQIGRAMSSAAAQYSSRSVVAA